MRIALDISSLLKESTGVGTYARGLLSALPSAAGGAENVLLWANALRGPLPGAEAWRKAGFRLKRTRIPGRLLLAWWGRFSRPTVEDLLGEIDLFHSPNFFYHPHRPRTRTVATIHDLFFLGHPEQAERFGGRYFRKVLERHVPGIDHFIAVSEATARDLVAGYGADPGRVTVIHHGLDPAFLAPPAVSPEALVRKYGLERPYFLSVGTIEPRKNYPFLLRAFHLWRRASGRDDLLVIVGRRGWSWQEVDRTVEEIGAHGWLRFLGYVPRGDLPGLYRNARALVLATLWEGFCLPALEAMGSGIPVVAPGLPVLREVLGEAGLYFETNDTEAWLDRMGTLERDPEGISRRVAEGVRRARSFTWERAARATWEVYRTVLGNA